VKLASLQANLELILTQEEARAVLAQREEAVIFKLLELSRRIQELESASPQTPSSTPSSQIPVYQKPNAPKSRKKPGQKKGHPGARREAPVAIDRKETHALESCPHCGTTDLKVTRRRKRIIEDIKVAEAESVEHEIEGSWCPTCQKIVEPVVEDALPKASIGHRGVALTAWLHYGLGHTLLQILEVFNYHLRFKLSAGGLVQMWYRIQEILYPWYEQIGEEARKSAYLHADESGWRVNGVTYWIWCFTNHRLTYYLIDRCRGSPVLFQFLGEVFNGCLITDFWRAYDLVVSRSRQYCLAHLLREIHDVDAKNLSEAWTQFSRKLRRLLGDALRLYADRERLEEEEYLKKRDRLDHRLEALLFVDRSVAAEVRRISDRLCRSMEGLFTFLVEPEVQPTNNPAEREIRPAVIIRKNSLGNRSEKGADCQAVLMSIYRTLKRRGLNPIDTIVEALKEYVKTGVLPPLPTSDG